MTGPHVLVARLDSLGDVLLTGPAVRAVASRAERVTMLCGPRGRAAAELLPGVDAVIEHCAAWIDPDPDPVDGSAIARLLAQVSAARPDQAVIFTSFHQSALPLALLLRLAGVPVVAAVSEDYPGSLLDVRHRVSDDIHEVERALSLVATLGYELPEGDDGRLAVRDVPPYNPVGGQRPYVVVHPGASVPARAWPADRHAALVDRLVARGHRVVVTGSVHERPLAARVIGSPRDGVVDLTGAVSFAGLARVLADAAVVVVANTGPAHLAAAVGTPVVSLYAPTVPAVRWAPWRVPHVVMGRQDIACAGCRARECPVPGHPCLDDVPVGRIADMAETLIARPVGGAAEAGR